MTDGARCLPGRLVVPLPVVGFDGPEALGDDPPPLDKHLLIEVVAPVEGMAEVDLYVVQRDLRDGLAEPLDGLGHPAGHGHGASGVGLLLLRRMDIQTDGQTDGPDQIKPTSLKFIREKDPLQEH